MYISKIDISNIKSLEQLTLEFDPPYAGWHVLLGDNGSGKSTILKSVALSLLGERQGYALNEKFQNWITRGAKEGVCALNLKTDLSQDLGNREMHAKFDGNIPLFLVISSQGLKVVWGGRDGKPSQLGTSKIGFYSSSYGPYRRVGSKESKDLSRFSDGNLENHITLFDNSYSLGGAVQWLMDLKFESLSEKDDSFLDRIIWFINNSELLPDGIRIDQISHKGVFFKDDDKQIEIYELSDGYQSIFALAIEILRQMRKSFDLEELIEKDGDGLVVNATGVVMIDEIATHLHPKWQAEIGNWFKKNFPRIQFIVTTHSPIICQSAEGGSIWKVEHRKSHKETRRIKGQEFSRMVYGSIADALGTESFGDQQFERSDASRKMLDRLAELNMKSIRGLCSDAEKQELKDLKAILPSQKLD